MNKKTIQMYFGSSLYEAWFSEDVFQSGMGDMVISRKTTGGAVVGVVFLCDHFCLGVKDCLPFMESEAGYRGMLQKIRGGQVMKAVNAGYVKKYLLGLVEWAKEIGFYPHADYRFCSEILRGIPVDENATFQYGKDGTPFYMNGPHDEPYRIKQIVNTLMAYRQRTGKEAHYTLMGLTLPPELLQELGQECEVPVQEINVELPVNERKELSGGIRAMIRKLF